MASILLEKQKKKDKYTLKELKTLGHELLSSRAHINNLPLLLTFVSPSSPPQYVLESLLSLQSFFTPLLPQLPSSSSYSKKSRLHGGLLKKGDQDPELIYRTWVRSKFDEFVNLLADIVVSQQSDDALREVVFDTLMEFVKSGNGGRFHSAIYHRLLHAFVHSTAPANILADLLASKYFKYIDVRYFTYISLHKLVKILEAKGISGDKIVTENGADGSHSKESVELSVQKIHNILTSIPLLEGLDEKSVHDMWSGSGISSKEDVVNENPSILPKVDNKQLKTGKHNCNVLSPAAIAKKMKLKFTKAWISFLRLPLPVDVYKEVLVSLHQEVIPHLSNPIMLCDFLTRSYDIGGVVSVMALSSLFLLMTQHGLEYPNFYEKIYALLVPSIFMAKHRAKFFQLVDSCLKSPLLPAYLAAGFAKKLSRLALSVPPSGALVIIALIHNLLRRHPSINFLVHREVGDETRTGDSKAEESEDHPANEGAWTDSYFKKLGIDQFNNEQGDPMKSNAMRSSLWEIDTLRHHYCPPVSRFVLSLENDLTVRAKTTEVSVQDFSSGSYATIFGDEVQRRVKQVPLAFYKATPTSLFSESDFACWTFRYEKSDKNITNTCEENDNISAKRQRIESS